jgi:hypothetical protein
MDSKVLELILGNMGAIKGVKKFSLDTVKLTGKVAAGTSQATSAAGAGASNTMTKMAVGKKVKFGFGKKKGDSKGIQTSLATADSDDLDEGMARARGPAPIDSFDESEQKVFAQGVQDKKYPLIEL